MTNNNFVSSYLNRCIKAILLLIIFSQQAMAQQKQFTLEDLNRGGRNYYKLSPENRWTTWWGDQLIHTDVEACSTIDLNTGKRKNFSH